MSEVSREVAIIVLNNEKNHLWQGKEETRNDAYDKAISDMGKLQKIEDVMNFKCRDCSIPCDYYFNEECKLDKIDRILKGE